MSGCAGWQSVNPVCRVGQVLGGAAKSFGNDVFTSIAHYFAGVASAAVTWLWQQLNVATSIDLTSPGIKADLLATGAIAALIATAMFLIQLIGSVLRQEPGGLARAVRGLGVCFIGAAFAVAATQVVLAAVDGLCNGVVEFALNTDLRGMGSKLVVAATLSQIANPAGLLLISFVLILAVVIIWIALMIRKMLIIISAVFAPIAFGGAPHDSSRAWVRRWIEVTLALVFSKLIIVIIFMIGLSVLNGAGNPPHPSTTQAITSLCIGALTLLLAGFAPWLAVKMVHFAGDAIQAVHVQASAATSGGRSAVAVPQKVAGVVSRPFGGMSSAKTAASSASGARGAAQGQAKFVPTKDLAMSATSSGRDVPRGGSGPSGGSADARQRSDRSGSDGSQSRESS